MSRGPGKLQREIVAHLGKQSSPITLEKLRWDLRGEDGSDLPRPWAYAVERAVRNLASPQRGIIRIDKRRLGSLDEWVAHYPAKTLDGSVRRLRTNLLPILAAWLVSADAPGPRFSADENEQFAFGGDKSGFGGYVAAQLRRKRHGGEWAALEPHLWEALRSHPSDEALYLLVRGRQMFTDSPVKTTRSFRGLLQECTNRQLLPPSVLAQLQSFADRTFPPEKARFLALKSQIYRCIQPVRIRQPDLKPEALQVLLAAQPEYMMAQPGFKPPPPRRDGVMPFPEEDRWRDAVPKGTPLSRLIDHSAFQRFQFLALAR